MSDDDLLNQLRLSASQRKTEPAPAAPTDPRSPSPEDPDAGPSDGIRREIWPGHPEWPERLSQLHVDDQPRCLYVEGRPLSTGNMTVAVVGTRRPTSAGVDAAEQLTRGLVEAGCEIVSGLAMGIDTIAHRTALRHGGYTAAVLGCGLDVNYPLKNRKLKEQIRESGTLVTEHPDGVQPLAHHFPLRNRIVAGVAEGVLVIEGGMKSGALITARLAADMGRDVWGVPGSVRNPMAKGPNELIRTLQARLVTHVKHIFEEIAPSLVWDEGVRARPLEVEALTKEERRILAVLDDVPLTPDEIIRHTELTLGEVALSVSRLEVRGFVVRRSGGYEISSSGARVKSSL